MVTEAELQTQQQQLQQQRQQLEEAQRQAEALKVIPDFTQQQLRARTQQRLPRPIEPLAERTKRQTEVTQRKELKEKTLSDIQSSFSLLEQQEAEYQKTYQEYQNYLAEQQAQAQAEQYNYALRVYLGQTSGSQISRVPEAIRLKAQAKAEEIERGQARLGLLEYKKQVEEIAPIELKVDLAKLKIEPSQFEKLSQEQLKKLESKGLITLQEFQQPLAPTQREEVLKMSLVEGERYKSIPAVTDILGGQKNDTSRISSVQSGKVGGFLGFSSVGNWINTNIIGSPKGAFKEGFQEESYSSQLGGFVSASQSGASATAYIRPPTPEERIKIETAQYKGSFKGLLEQYDKLSQKIEAKFKDKEKSPAVVKFENWFSGLPKGNLTDIPYSPQGFAPTGTKVFFKTTDIITSGLEKAGINTTTPSLQVTLPKQTAEDIFLIGSLLTFDPLMRTGAVKKKTISEQLSKNRFSGLGEELASSETKVSEFYQAVRSEVIKKKVGEEQLKVLDEIYKKFFKNKPKGQEDFKKLVQSLYEQGDFKGVPLNYYARPSEQQLSVVLDVQGLPQMQGASSITSSLSGLEVQPIQQKSKQTPVLVEQQKVDLAQEENQKSIFIVSPKTAQAQKIKQPSKEGLATATAVATALISQPAQAQSPAQAQKIKQPQIPITATPQIPKIPTPTIPKLITDFIKKKKKERSLIQEEFFEAFVRRKGKPASLGKFSSEREARKKLFVELESSISAGGFIEKGGRKIRTSLLGTGFNPSKRDPYGIIEPRARRLNFARELREIREGKKEKKKMKWF